jgi:CubicO group peptidase (beta-lactamase class C family)
MSRAATVDHLFADFSLAGAPGAALLVIDHGERVLAANYGLANLETGAACLNTTNFRLASVSKQFTAMTILILAARGKLSLDDSLRKFFPDFPAYGEGIAVKHLLTHTSGLPAYEDLIPEGATRQVKDQDVLDLVKHQDRGMFPPGSKFHYSNSGYAVLAMITQTVSGVPFARFLRENIFHPLGMEQTVAYEAGVSTVPNRALGYASTVNKTTQRREFAPSDQSLTSAVLGDGGIYSSTHDLYQWDQALYTEKLIPRALREEAFTAFSSPTDFNGSGYGYGWYVGKLRGEKCVWHYGETCGFSTHIERFPERKRSLILLTNRRDAPVARLSQAVMDLFWT